MKKAVFLTLSLLVFFVISCSDNPMGGSDTESVEFGENFTFVKSAERAEKTGEERSEMVSDPFEIDDVRIITSGDKKLMYIDVIQARGCPEAIPEKFEVIWDGIMLMIYPPQIAFYLAFNADACEELQDNVEETIVLDLHKLFGDFEDSAEYTVINASKSHEGNDVHINR